LLTGLSVLFRLPLSQPDAGSAAVLVYEFDAPTDRVDRFGSCSRSDTRHETRQMKQYLSAVNTHETNRVG